MFWNTGSSTISITNNESSTICKVEYKIDDGSYQTASSNLSISAGATDTSVSQNISDGTKITWRVTDSFTSGDFTNMSAETQTQSATVDCAVATTFASSFSTCSNGAKTNTASITNDSSATAYYLVEYKIDSGSYQTAATNLSVGQGATNTSLTASVPHGSTITWRFKDSSTSGNFTGASYEDQAATASVDCDPNSTISSSFGTCSSGSATSTISITNNEISTGSLDLTDSSVLITSTNEIVIPSSEYSKVATGDAVVYTQGSSGAQENNRWHNVFHN